MQLRSTSNHGKLTITVKFLVVYLVVHHHFVLVEILWLMLLAWSSLGKFNRQPIIMVIMIQMAAGWFEAWNKQSYFGKKATVVILALGIYYHTATQILCTNVQVLVQANDECQAVVECGSIVCLTVNAAIIARIPCISSPQSPQAQRRRRYIRAIIGTSKVYVAHAMSQKCQLLDRGSDEPVLDIAEVIWRQNSMP